MDTGRSAALQPSVQLLSHVWLRPHGLQHARLPCPSPNSQSLLKLMSIKSVMPSNHLILCYPLLLPSISPSIRVFSNEPVLSIRWPKYWSFSFSISPSNEYSGLISLRIDWLDLLTVQGTQEFSPTPQFKSYTTLEARNKLPYVSYVLYLDLSIIAIILTNTTCCYYFFY